MSSIPKPLDMSRAEGEAGWNLIYPHLWEVPPSPWNPSLETPCLMWPHLLPAGTTHLQIRVGGRWLYGHRCAYKNRYPAQSLKGWYICHECDRPRCMRHLYRGGPQTNAEDKARIRIEDLPTRDKRAKLSPRELYRLYVEHTSGLYSTQELAMLHGVSSRTIRRMLGQTEDIDRAIEVYRESVVVGICP